MREWSACLARLRESRGLILRDAEAFHEAATSLEYIGQIITGELRNGMGRYVNDLVELASSSATCTEDNSARLFEVVREARNMAVHEGAWARHLGSRLIDTFLILEESIITKMKRIEDLMVRDPVVAEDWQMVSHVRRVLLANSFSQVPIFTGNAWRLISDAALVRFIKSSNTPPTRKEKLEIAIGEAIGEQKIKTTEAVCCAPDEDIDMLISRGIEQPVLVIEEIAGKQRLVGIVTPFDLL